MRASDTWTAIPMGSTVGRVAVHAGTGEGITEPPRDPLPWSDEVNDLYTRVVQGAWDDLIRADGRRTSYAARALAWLEEGANVGPPDQPVSLFEVWGWVPDRVIHAARARFENRATLGAERATRLNARSTRVKREGAPDPQVACRVLLPSTNGSRTPDKGHPGGASPGDGRVLRAEPPNGPARPIHAAGATRTREQAAPAVGPISEPTACTAGFVVPNLWEVEPPSSVAVQPCAPPARRPL